MEKLFQVIPNRLVQGKNNISELGMSVLSPLRPAHVEVGTPLKIEKLT